MVVSTSETGDVADANSEIDSDQDEASALPAYVIHTKHRLSDKNRLNCPLEWKAKGSYARNT